MLVNAFLLGGGGGGGGGGWATISINILPKLAQQKSVSSYLFTDVINVGLPF